MDTIISKNPLASVVVELSDPQMAWNEIMNNLIQKIPGFDDSFYRCNGVSNETASFYFKGDNDGAINDVLYNNLIAPRLKYAGSQNGLKSVDIQSSNFTTDYQSVFSKIIYNLSAADEALQQRQAAEVAADIKKLAPVWNSWVDDNGEDGDAKGIKKMDSGDANGSLMIMTNTLLGKWLNKDEYESKIRNDRSYIYTHINEFSKIFSKMPLTVPQRMCDLIIEVLQTQGSAGTITTQISLANQVLMGIRSNISNPSEENGGLPLTNTTKLIPGRIFQPDEPLTVQKFLTTNPAQNEVSYEFSVNKSEDTKVTIDFNGSASFTIPIVAFVGVKVGGSAEGHIFNEDYTGVSYSVKVTCKNVMSIPNLSINPLLYDVSTQIGWMNASVLQEAIKNGVQNVNTGYSFTSKPNFDFGLEGDFGYLEGLILSQFPSVEITFNECDVTKVKKYFEQHAYAKVTFLGIPLGGVSETTTYDYSYSNETQTSISVTMNPPAPGIIPGAVDITGSLCQLLAINAEFPGV